jgi:hypothetical protein
MDTYGHDANAGFGMPDGASWRLSPGEVPIFPEQYPPYTKGVWP